MNDDIYYRPIPPNFLLCMRKTQCKLKIIKITYNCLHTHFFHKRYTYSMACVNKAINKAQPTNMIFM